MLQPPQVGAVQSDQRRIEQAGIEQGDLSPQRIPLTGQKSQVAPIIEGPHDSGDERDQNAGRPDAGMPQLQVFRTDTF